jgi:hypothetical protein
MPTSVNIFDILPDIVARAKLPVVSYSTPAQAAVYCFVIDEKKGTAQRCFIVYANKEGDRMQILAIPFGFFSAKDDCVYLDYNDPGFVEEFESVVINFFCRVSKEAQSRGAFIAEPSELLAKWLGHHSNNDIVLIEMMQEFDSPRELEEAGRSIVPGLLDTPGDPW